MTRRAWLIPVLLAFAALAIAGCGGEKKVQVPDVKGLGWLKADLTLDDAGLKMDARPLMRGPFAHVVSQSPAASAEVPEGTTVTVVFPKSKPAKPAPKPAAPAPTAQEKSGGWTGVNADNYQLAKAVCRAYPKEEIARQFKLPPSANEFTIAEKFAEALFSPDFQVPVIEGCLAGLGG
jgi:hypothetical protein